MPTMNVRPLKPTSNAKMLNTIRRQASTDYRARIPEATQANISDTLSHLHNNRPLMNEFMDVLVNRIGSVIVRNKTWTNPLAQFKTGMLNYGDTIEEIQTGLLLAHTYDPDREYLERDIFGTELAPAEANFHKVNRQNYYKVTVNEALLKRAFLEDNGISNFIDGLMSAPVTSDNWDEFLATCNLIPEYEHNGGFHHVRVGDIADWSSDGPETRFALRRMRALADTLPFISTKYNAAHMPTFAERDELIILASPEFQAAVDVEALAGAFNVAKMDMYGRVITIPQECFGVDEIQAVMTTKNFFVIADQLIENRTADNPVALHRNYFLHHWQVISASRFVPAIAFTKTLDDEVIAVQTPAINVPTPTADEYTRGLWAEDYETGVAITNQNPAAPGSLVGVHVDPATFVGSDDDEVQHAYGAVAWSVTGGTSMSTFITPQGVLHVGADEQASMVYVNARPVAIDPADPVADHKGGTLTVNIGGPTLPRWPVRPDADKTPAADTNSSDVLATLKDTDGAVLATVNAATDGGSILSSTGTVDAKSLVLDTAEGVSGSVKVSNGGKTVTVTLDGGDGPKDYTFTVPSASAQ